MCANKIVSYFCSDRKILDTMSSLPSFVSETEIEEQKKKRQEEWERVRTAEQPKGTSFGTESTKRGYPKIEDVPDPDYDPRSLYERLKEQREKKQYETEEASRLKHLVRGLDSEEVGFLDFVDNMKAAEESKRRVEEKNLIEEIKKTMETETLIEPATSTSIVATKKPSTSKNVPKGPSKQAQIIAAGIKRRSSGDKLETKITSPEQKRAKLKDCDESQTSPLHDDAVTNGIKIYPQSYEVVAVRPTALRQVGILPGLASYSPDSGSSDDSDTSESDGGCVMYSNPEQQIAQLSETVEKLKRQISEIKKSS